METLLNALSWIVGGLILILLSATLRRPLERLVRLATRTSVGPATLWALSGVGGLMGLHLGVNLVNALVLGMLGTPSSGLLLMLNQTLVVWMQKRGGHCDVRLGLPLSLPAEMFGEKNSVKGNRQDSLPCWIKRLFETFLEFQKIQQPVENTFSTG